MKELAIWMGWAMLAANLSACGVQAAPVRDSAAANAGKADGTGYVGDSIPRIDEIGYLEQLRALRPDLANSKLCSWSLVMKPQYRARLLHGTEKPADIQSSEYTDEQRTLDTQWIAEQQQAELGFCVGRAGGCSSVCNKPCGACSAADAASPLPDDVFRIANYPLCQFVGYREGIPGPIVDDRGLTWKVFFEFDDFLRDLGVDAYLEFSRRLADAGFNGDSKIDMQPGLERFLYNNIVVHGHSMQDALIAESIGFELFGPALAGHGRGHDVKLPGKAGLDWHHFLCSESLDKLDPDAIAFIEYRDPQEQF
jgi:hypothetical protein